MARQTRIPAPSLVAQRMAMDEDLLVTIEGVMLVDIPPGVSKTVAQRGSRYGWLLGQKCPKPPGQNYRGRPLQLLK